MIQLLGGTPHSGVTDAMLADPLWPRPLRPSGGDRALMELCIDEEAAQIRAYAEALNIGGFPTEVRAVLQECKKASEARHRAFTSLLRNLP
jgi:hypothetical protein